MLPSSLFELHGAHGGHGRQGCRGELELRVGHLCAAPRGHRSGHHWPHGRDTCCGCQHDKRLLQGDGHDPDVRRDHRDENHLWLRWLHAGSHAGSGRHHLDHLLHVQDQPLPRLPHHRNGRSGRDHHHPCVADVWRREGRRRHRALPWPGGDLHWRDGRGRVEAHRHPQHRWNDWVDRGRHCSGLGRHDVLHQLPRLAGAVQREQPDHRV